MMSEAVPSIAEPAAPHHHKRSSAASASGSSSSSSSSSSVASDADGHLSFPRPSRPSIGSRKESGTMIVSRDSHQIEMSDEEYGEGDARCMSPKRSTDETNELQKLQEDARENLAEQARTLQASLLAIVERVERVRDEHEKLEGGNRFLQSYIGELMSTSRITSTGAPKGKKGKNVK